MIDEILNDAEKRMQKSLDALQSELAKLRTGRAHPSLLEHIMVPYYGSDAPLSQVANISAPDARTLAIQPWEKPLIPVIEKAILESGLGLNPATASDVIRLPIPALTEERRKELVKMLKAEAEKAKISVRNTRRDCNNDFKDLVKDKEISEDDERRAQERVQKLTDQYVAKVDEIFASKEADLMAI
jgi:ribosome recycling factor